MFDPFVSLVFPDFFADLIDRNGLVGSLEKVIVSSLEHFNQITVFSI
jgi:hypothetical protein